MPTTTSYGGFTVPILGDTDNVPASMDTYADQVEPLLNMPFPNAAARTAALTAAGLGSGKRGMRTWLDTPGHEEIYDGTNWRVPAFLEKIVAGSTITGSTPGATAGFIVQTGTVVMTIGPGGGCSLTWPSAFPTGIVSAFVFPGDANTETSFTGLIAQQTTTGWGGIAYQSNTPMSIGALVRGHYLAFGW